MKKIKDIKWKATGIELFYVMVLVLLCVKMAYALSEIMDIQLYDESTYLYQGNHFRLSYLFKDGCVYWAWYKLLSLFVSDTITLYYLNYTVLLCLNPILIYILLRKMGKEQVVSALFAIFFLISNINIISNPFIMRLALALILGTFIAILSVKSSRARYLIALVGIILLVYTRPEYTLSLFIFSLGSIVIFLLYPSILSNGAVRESSIQETGNRPLATGSYLLSRYGKSHKQALIILILITLLLNIFVFFVKNPARSKRSIIAFGQHYGLHLYLRGEIKEDSSINWEKILKKNFGTSQSIMKAILNKPGEMARHVFSNIKHLPNQSKELFTPFNIKNDSIKKVLLVIMGLVFIFLIIMAIIKRKKPGKPRGEPTGDEIFYFLSIIIMIPSFISVFLIFPRSHYLLVLFGILSIMAVKNLPGVPGTPWIRGISYMLLLLILYGVHWLASGNIGIFPGKVKSIHDNKCTNVAKIRSIRDVQVKPGIVFLGYGGSMKAYIDNYQYVDINSKDVPFNEFIQREKINMIQVDNVMIKNPRLADDQEFMDFIAKIPNNAWEKKGISHCGGCLAVKRDIQK